MTESEALVRDHCSVFIKLMCQISQIGYKELKFFFFMIIIIYLKEYEGEKKVQENSQDTKLN